MSGYKIRIMIKRSKVKIVGKEYDLGKKNAITSTACQPELAQADPR